MLAQRQVRKVVYKNIHWLMEQAAKNKHDRPEFETKWTTRRQKTAYTYRQKLMHSWTKTFNDNLEAVKNSQDLTAEIKSLIAEEDYARLDQ